MIIYVCYVHVYGNSMAILDGKSRNRIRFGDSVIPLSKHPWIPRVKGRTGFGRDEIYPAMV